jgi:hypothetical protein
MIHYYTGKDLFLSFNGFVISREWMHFTFERSVTTVDVTPLGSADRVLRPTTHAGRWTLQIVDDIENGEDVLRLLAPGASGTLVIGPRGNAPGQPRLSFAALVTQVERPFSHDDTVRVQFHGVKNGPMLADDGDRF